MIKHYISNEIMQFIAILIIMRKTKLLQIKIIWNKHLQIYSVASVMFYKRFYRLGSKL